MGATERFAHLESEWSAESASDDLEQAQLDHLITACFGQTNTDNRPVRRTLRFRELIGEFSVPETRRGTLSAAEYHALDASDPDQKRKKQAEKNGRYFVLAAFDANGRRAENISGLHGFVLDFDSGRTTREVIESRLAPYTFLAYTSYSHRPDHQKWRVILPYSRPVAAAEHKAVYAHLQQLFGGDLDDNCEKSAQIYYTPACPHDVAHEYQVFHRLSALFNPDMLEGAAAGNDTETAPESCQGRASGDAAEQADLVDALRYIDPDDRKEWIDVGLAIKHDLKDAGLSVWLKWSGASSKFDLDEALKVWNSFNPRHGDSGITLRSVFRRATQNGWRKASAQPVPDYVSELNKDYFLAQKGKRLLVFKEGEDPMNGRKALDPMFLQDFRVKFLNRKTTVIDEHGKAKSMRIVEAWLEHSARRQYEGIIFAPNKEVPGYYNLWRGFTVQPCRGRWTRMKKHMKDILCSQDARAHEYLMNWLAYCVQHPERQGEVAVVLRGGRGTGKGIFVRSFGQLFGPHFFHITQGRHLTGNHNAHLEDCVVLFADEAFWAGDKQGESTLKGLITEPTITIEPKFVDAKQVPNMLHIIMASNADWVVPAGKDERRYFVLDVDDSRKQDSGYFAALQREMDSGGSAAMLYELQNRNLSRFDVRNVPQTAALVDQKVLSLAPHESWWFEKLKAGSLTQWYPWGQIPKGALHDDYVETLKLSGITRRATETELGMKLRSLLPRGYPQGRKTTLLSGTDRVPGYVFPPLDICRKYFENMARMEGYDWED